MVIRVYQNDNPPKADFQLMDIYNSHSIKARIAITKQCRQGYLFMPITDKALNRKIDTLETQTNRIPYFRKNPVYGSQIFECCDCGKERIYGHSLHEPENPNLMRVLILCEGSCSIKKPVNTPHKFIRIARGREEKIL